MSFSWYQHAPILILNCLLCLSTINYLFIFKKNGIQKENTSKVGKKFQIFFRNLIYMMWVPYTYSNDLLLIIIDQDFLILFPMTLILPGY